MKLHTHYLAVSARMRAYHIIHLDMRYDAYTRDISPTTVALQMAFKSKLVQIGGWRDCMACTENWRKLKVTE